MNKEFYYLHMQEDEDGGVAYSPEDNDIEFVEDLNDFKEVPFVFNLRDGQFQDYLDNDLAWPIFSEKFKDIVAPFLPNLNIQWIKAEINDFNKKSYTAFILKFNFTSDVLDKDRTIFAANNFVVKAVLSREKVKGMNFFTVPGSDFRLIVSEDVKLEIEKNNLTGAYFSKVPVT